MIAAAVTLLLLIIKLYYIVMIYGRPLRFKAKQNNSDTPAKTLPPVSVVVYSYGDAEKLERNLPYVLEQDYPEFEVIVVNDGNDSDTEDALKRLSSKYSNLYYTFVPVDTQYLSHKKLAITMGVKAAKNDIVLFTEGHCRPLSNRWIREVANRYEEGVEVVVGYCAYDRGGGLFQRFFSYDNLRTGLENVSNALAGAPFSADGRNLSYRRSLFFAHKGFSKTLNMHIGADSLFVNEAATKENCAVVYSHDSLVVMDTVEDIALYGDERGLYMAARRYMRGFAPIKYALSSVTALLFNLSALLTIVAGLFLNLWLILVGFLAFAIYYTVYCIVYNKSAVILGQKSFKGWILLLTVSRYIFELVIRSRRSTVSENVYTTH
jgi:cellulose synthase/poly-beta-1,6-N-acetylglucosamine synthase-like glycosyltransferase